MSKPRSQLLALAEKHAVEHHKTHPDLFDDVPIRVSLLLKRLGIKLHLNAYQREDGRVERYANSNPRYIIGLRSDLNATRGRYVLAHELGHIVLLDNHLDLLSRWNLQTRERFANVFGRELLIPIVLRPRLREHYRQVSSALEFVRLMGTWGIHPMTGLRFVATHLDWTAGDQKIVLKVAVSPNRFTKREERLRVIAATFDHNKFYIPTNQSFHRLTTDETWLTGLSAGREFTHDDLPFLLHTRTERSGRRYVTKEYGCAVSAVRMTSHRGATRGSFLVLVRPRID